MLVYGLELQKQKVVKVRKSMNAPSLPIQHWQTNGKTRGYLQQTQVLPSVPLSFHLLLMERRRRGNRVQADAETQTKNPASPPAVAVLSWCRGMWDGKNKRILTNSLSISSSRDLQMAQDNKSCQWNAASAHDSCFVWDKSVLLSWSTNGPLLQPYSADHTSHLHYPSGDAQMIFICPCVNI